MGRYKGRRESSPGGRNDKPLGDPFEEDSSGNRGNGPGAWFASAGRSLGSFFRSKKGKVTMTVVGCVAVAAVAAGVALSLWVKPPEIPPQPVDPTPSKVDPVKTDDELPDEPDEDDLYPDDGYGGDMPHLSGNRKDGVFTFLLIGTDMGGGNTDTLMVASYDTKNQDINIMSVPRDTMINASWDIKKINSVYSRYKDGVGALQKRIKTLVGFAPDFYVKVELDMFVELVDLIGGVEFNVPQDMNYDDPYQDLHIHLKKGLQTLDGPDAMGLVRFRRYSEGDIKRVEVQQSFMKALIKQCLKLENWGKIKAYIDLAMDNVETDLEFGSVVWFAANVLGLNSAPALNAETDVRTFTIPGDYYGTAYSRSTHSQQSYVTIYPKQVVELVNEYFNPYEQKVTTSMLDAMSIRSNGDIASSTGSLQDTTHNAVMAVQRGEAYYDSNGHIAYGSPPKKDAGPSQDDDGNYYVLDEDGNVVYTDEEGNILDKPDEPALPDEGSEGTEGSGQTGNSSTGGGTAGDNPAGDSPTGTTPDGGNDGGEAPTDPGALFDDPPAVDPGTITGGGPGGDTPADAGTPSGSGDGGEPSLPTGTDGGSPDGSGPSGGDEGTTGPASPTDPGGESVDAPPDTPEEPPEPEDEDDGSNEIPGWLLT